MPDRTQQTSRGWYECEYCFDIHLYFIGIYRFWVNRIVIVSQEAKQQNILSSVNLNIYSIAAVIDSIVTRFTIGLLWLKIIKQSSFFVKNREGNSISLRTLFTELIFKLLLYRDTSNQQNIFWSLHPTTKGVVDPFAHPRSIEFIQTPLTSRQFS